MEHMGIFRRKSGGTTYRACFVICPYRRRKSFAELPRIYSSFRTFPDAWWAGI